MKIQKDVHEIFNLKSKTQSWPDITFATICKCYFCRKRLERTVKKENTHSVKMTSCLNQKPFFNHLKKVEENPNETVKIILNIKAFGCYHDGPFGPGAKLGCPKTRIGSHEGVQNTAGCVPSLKEQMFPRVRGC